MKKLIILSMLLFALPVFAFDPASITFGITSTAVTATSNLRIGYMYGQLAKDGNVPIQAMPVPRNITNYFLTKSQVVTFSGAMTGILIQTDQDTKMFTGSDLTNSIKIPANVDYFFTLK